MPEALANIIALGNNPFQVAALILQNGGLVLFFPILVWMSKQLWVNWLQNKYLAKKKFVLLAVDVPQLNEQSMKSVELIISALHGVHFNPNRKEKYWIGVVQDRFSLEIVSIDGYIQYFIYCDNYNVDLVKGAIYAQYPEAEIVEVEDYVHNVPPRYPHEEYEMWGTEFVLANDDVYPIKTYEFFEHNLTGVFADPMAAILELLSRLRPGEQAWLQLVIVPEGIDWRQKSLKKVADLIGKKLPVKKTIFDRLTDVPLQALELAHDAVFTTPERTGAPVKKTNSSEETGDFQKLTTGEKIGVEEIQKKAARLHFKTKFRFVYVAPKEIINTYRVVGSVFGAIKQFNALDLNSFRAGGRTVVSMPTYWLVKTRRNWRRNKLMMGYRNRSNWTGEPPFILSHVELATIFHFPSELVLAPLVSKTDSKKAEPPSRLPLENPFGRLRIGHQRVTVPEPLNAPVAAADAVREQLPVAEKSIASELQLPPPPPGGAVTPTPTPPPAPSTAPTPSTTSVRGDYPLHSMPGLPPGVRPVEQAAAPSEPTRQPEQALHAAQQNGPADAPPSNLPF